MRVRACLVRLTAVITAGVLLPTLPRPILTATQRCDHQQQHWGFTYAAINAHSVIFLTRLASQIAPLTGVKRQSLASLDNRREDPPIDAPRRWLLRTVSPRCCSDRGFAGVSGRTIGARSHP
jgi:hypothetical protein